MRVSPLADTLDPLVNGPAARLTCGNANINGRGVKGSQVQIRSARHAIKEPLNQDGIPGQRLFRFRLDPPKSY